MTTKQKKTIQEICIEWHKNKIINPDKPINPISKYSILKNGKVYKELNNLCSKIDISDIINDNNDDIPIKKKTVLSKSLTKDLCDKWMKNKFINPITNYTIKETGAIYKEFKKDCPKIISNTNTNIIKEPKIKKKNIKTSDKPIINDINDINSDNDDIVYFPEIEDPDFKEKLINLKEFNIHKIHKYNDINSIADFEKKANELCGGFDKSFFQYLMGHYLSYRTPYKSMLIYYSVGVGKTCTAITIAENFLITHNSYEEPKIWVIMPQSVEDGFKQQIFKKTDYKLLANQCTGDLYAKLGQITENMTDIEVDKRIKKLIKSRYTIFTYEGFATFYENNYLSKNKVATDKIIIVDEAHNIRQGNSDEKKRVYNSLIEVAKNGINNKIILLSATPMYNEPTDLFDLIELLLLNDKRDITTPKHIFNDKNELTDDAKHFLETVASVYISYLRGKNPFNFAFKLSPTLSNIKILDKVIPFTENGNPIESIDFNWIDKVKDGIVISKLGEKQLKYLESRRIVDENIQNNFKGLQPMNIVYDDNIGSKGFYNIFRRIDVQANNESFKVSYNPKFNNSLLPDDKHLGKFSGKILNILNIITKTTGITIIYSKYLHSGLIPIAIALEHNGFSRYGTDNILDDNDAIIKLNPPKYQYIKNPSYCILTSDNNNIMGNTTISKLINIINDPTNTNGEKIKVILMSPVAGEGLNIFNVREIHLLEAWYHFNRIDQIIGRGIRNCSHKKLPLELRNVSVFMHCAINNYDKETADIHAYRISSRKLYQTFIIDNIIRNNAIDCSLFKYINYFPKSMFKLGSINITTSQGINIDYELGDDPIYEPKCIDKKYKEDMRGFRQDTYKHLSLNIQMKLKNIIINDFIRNEIYFISYKDINDLFNYINNDILMYAITISIYPNIIIDGYILIPHENGLHIIKVINDFPLKITLVKNNIEKKEIKLNEDEIKLYNNINTIKDLPFNKAIIALYSSLDLLSFNFIINKILSSNILSEIDTFIANCLYHEGVLISNKEITLGIGISSNKYIGFINIFNDEFEPLLFNDGNFKSLTPKQLEQLKKNRQNINIPDMKKEKYVWGLFVPVFTDKDKKNKKNVFKLLTPGEAYGKKTGIVCTSLHKPQHKSILDTLSIPDGKYTKESYCITIANELYTKKRISLNPSWKPL